MEWFEALILGAIQGLTEFLPVSSSGHLQIFGAMFGHVESEDNLAFVLVVHAATVCSTIVVFRKEILSLLKAFFGFRWDAGMQYVVKILMSMIPIGIVGVFFKDEIEERFSSGLMVVGVSLLITAVLLSFSYYAKPRTRENISFRDSFIIGLAQACAVLPGLSRSGTTIATGLLLGNRKEQIAQFSFLMVLIPILGEMFLSIVSGEMMEVGIGVTNLLIGFVSAFVTGYLACSWMINIVKKGKLIYFAIYCLIAGLAVIGSEIF